MPDPAFRFIDLFAGVGGFHHALSAPGFDGQCVLACDIDDSCREVYAATWPEMRARGAIVENIRDLTQLPDGTDRPLEQVDKLVPDHEVLCAGFPCQPFSKSGAQQGISDRTRGTLFFDILRIIDAKRPQFLVLENVRNLAGPRHVETWRVITSSLRARGYRVSEQPVVFSPHLLHPDLGGRPQSRDRVFILATRVAEPDEISDQRHVQRVLHEAPLVERVVSEGWDPSRWDIHDYLDDDNAIANLADYQLRDEERYWIRAWQAFVQGMPSDDLPGFPIWVDEFKRTTVPASTEPWKADFYRKNMALYRDEANRTFIDWWLRQSWSDPGRPAYRVGDFPASRRKFEWQARRAQPKREDRDLTKLTLHLRPSGLRVKPATYLPALVAITQTSIIGSRMRRITPVEAARLQGLPDDLYRAARVPDAVAYRQVGNGVNVGVVQHVARALFSASGIGWGSAGDHEQPEQAA
jgi:DNA (cytosine-5)-methyltransferase 1